VSGFDSAAKGRQTVVVEANGRRASFAVTVKEPVDPAVWAPVTGGFAGNITGIVYGGGKFVAAGYNDDKPNEGIIAYSADGVNWTKSNARADFKISSVFSCGGKFFFAGFNVEGKPVLRSSSDGLRLDLNQFARFEGFAEGASRCTGIAYGGGTWVAVFDRGKAAYSTNGYQWGDIAVSKDDTWDGKTCVFFNGANFVALDASGAYRISRDTGRGIVGSTGNWERGGGVSINGRPITGVVFGGGKWIGIGPDNAVGWTADGITWTAADNISAGNGGRVRRGDFTGAAYGAGRFVAVSNQGAVVYSRDGYNWTQVYSSTFGSTAIRAVAYGNGTFVAVGDNGRIAYSRVVE
jgi:hypothetical protein